MYAGVDVGPGPLEMDGALERRGAREIVVTAILEGCIGETLAALEAARHADLAWSFVGWALARFPELAADARAAFAKPLAPSSPARVDLTANGVLTGVRRDEIRAAAMHDTVAPLEDEILRAA